MGHAHCVIEIENITVRRNKTMFLEFESVKKDKKTKSSTRLLIYLGALQWVFLTSITTWAASRLLAFFEGLILG